LLWRILRFARISHHFMIQAQVAQAMENAALEDMAIV
jgi:hypothetical protein